MAWVELNVWTAHTNEKFSDLNYHRDKNFLRKNNVFNKTVFC